MPELCDFLSNTPGEIVLLRHDDFDVLILPIIKSKPGLVIT